MPAAVEAEAAVLGTLLLDPATYPDVADVLPGPEWLYELKHQAIYAAMSKLWHDHGGKIDIVALTTLLRDRNQLEDIGGVDYLVKLGGSVPDTTGAKFYAGIVREKSIARQTIDAVGKALYATLDGGETPGAVLDALQADVTRLACSGIQRDVANVGELLQELYDRIASGEPDDAATPSGFSDIDFATAGGLHPNQMIIVAGRPAMGKSLFAQNIAESVAGRGIGVMLFSMEMSRQEIARRIMASQAGVSFGAIRRNHVGPTEFQNLQMAVGRMAEAPLAINDSPAMSVGQVRAAVRRQMQRLPVGLVVIDYLQLMTGKGDSRQEEVAGVSRGIKALAQELSIPIIAISQLNRAVESREGNRPRLSDLRESGGLEQDADVVMLLHRPWYYLPESEKAADCSDMRYKAECIIAKQRNGETATIELVFDGDNQRFKDKE